MRCGKILWLLAGILTCPFCLEAQRYPFVSYTPEDGLVSTRARHMFQDSKGRLYITSFGGLSVYDGARFTNYTIDDGLAANLINDVAEMGEDSIWIMPNVNRIQCLVRGRIRDIKPDGYCPVINKLLKSSNGTYYAFTDDGLFYLERNRFVRINLKDEHGRPINNYFSRGREISNKLFIITDPTIGYYPSPSYLVVYDPATGKTCISKKPPDIYAVTGTPENEILVGTSEGVKAVDTAALQRGHIVFTPLPSLYKSAGNLIVNYFYFDREQTLWLAAGNGVHAIDKHGRKKSFSVENGLPADIHFSIFQDREHTMWFMNEQTGLSKLSNVNFEFYPQIKPDFTASDLYADTRSDTVWFIDNQRQSILLLYPNGSRRYSIKNNSNWLYRIIPGGSKNFLTGNFEASMYDPEAVGGSARPRTVFSWRDSMQGVGMVNYPLRDSKGNLLFSNDKINVVLQNGQLISYPLGYFGDQFAPGPCNTLWVVTRSDKLLLFRLHPEEPSRYFELLKQYDNLAPGGQRSVGLDKEGNVWIGTRDMGLYCFSMDANLNLTLKQHLDTKKGLSDNSILYLHGDGQGNIWACSPVGLDKVQLKNNRWIVENITRGNNIYQKVFKIHTTKSGEHWALTSGGVIRIMPDAPAPPVTDNVALIFTEIKAGKDALNIAVRKPSLSYKKNDLQFQWAVPTFKDEKQTRFSYRLQGSSADGWTEPSPDAMVRFVNLAPGKYVLHVKAIFPNGLYPDTQAMYAFEILPPWWQAWWFRALILAACVALAALLVKGYVRRKLQRQKILWERQQAIEKERTRIASDMHDDLGAGLSTIRFLSEKVKRNPFNEATKNEIEKIAGISVELVENMNEIIWAMNEKNDTLEDLLFYTRSYAKEYCEEHQLQCTVEFPESIPYLFVSGELRRNVFLTIKESLHNIVKYADATSVEFHIAVNDHLIVTIKDNGRGFAPVEAGHLAGAEALRGSGNGLRNMRRRIESMGGMFDVITGRGVTVVLRVPLQKA